MHTNPQFSGIRVWLGGVNDLSRPPAYQKGETVLYHNIPRAERISVFNATFDQVAADEIEFVYLPSLGARTQTAKLYLPGLTALTQEIDQSIQEGYPLAPEEVNTKVQSLLDTLLSSGSGFLQPSSKPNRIWQTILNILPKRTPPLQERNPQTQRLQHAEGTQRMNARTLATALVEIKKALQHYSFEYEQKRANDHHPGYSVYTLETDYWREYDDTLKLALRMTDKRK